MPTIPSEGASKLKSAGSSRSRHNLVKVHLGLTLMLNSTYAMMMICLSNDVSLNPGPTVTQSTNLPTIRGFKISHLNVRSITHKMDSIRLLLKDNTLDIFTVSETWLSPKVTDAEITIPGYSVVRKDRNSRGGGVAMFIRDGIPFKTRMDITDSNTNCESLLIEINRHKCKKQFVCCIYKPPDFATEILVNHLEDIIAKVPEGADFALLGDFNIDLQGPTNSNRRMLLRFANSHSLHQLIQENTRITEHSSSVIDLFFVNNSHRVVGSGVVPLAISDHSLIYGIFKSGVPKAPPRIVEHRTYKKYNKSAFIKDINQLNWSIIDDMDVDSGVNLWNTLFSKVANSHAPIIKTRIKGIPAPWMTSEISQLMHDRDYHHTKAVKLEVPLGKV